MQRECWLEYDAPYVTAVFVRNIYTSLVMTSSCRLVSRSGLSVLQRILDTAAERSWQVTSVNLDTLTEAAFIKLLADLDYKKDFQIVIDCELERLNSILDLVKHSHKSGLSSTQG